MTLAAFAYPVALMSRHMAPVVMRRVGGTNELPHAAAARKLWRVT